MEETESRDRLSELPHSLILHILSFLSMKDVVSTTILSKRWKNLWTTVPCLNFCDFVIDEDDVETIRNFINRALIFWRGKKIHQFKIDLGGHFDMSLAKDIDLWVLFAVENKVEELNIHLAYHADEFCWKNAVTDSKKDIYRAPPCLNSCSSVKTLSLVTCNLRIPEPPPWNQLKSLKIDGFCFSEQLINRVLSGAPQLEVFMLRLLESHENLNIRSKSLKKLKIEKRLFFDCDSDDDDNGDDHDHPSTKTVLRIGCPNLEMLEISGILYSKCLLTNVSSLTDATLSFDGSHYYDNHGLSGKELLGEMLRQIFLAIRCVEKVTLSDWCIQALGVSYKEYLFSPLSNVKFLKLDIGSIQFDEMVHLLGIFPNVKTLVIRDLVSHADEFTRFETDLVNYNLLSLRTIEVTTDLLVARMFPLLEFLLRHASMLENMVISFRGYKFYSKKNLLYETEKLFKAAEKLLSMPRSSPTAKVILREK